MNLRVNIGSPNPAPNVSGLPGNGATRSMFSPASKWEQGDIFDRNFSPSGPQTNASPLMSQLGGNQQLTQLLFTLLMLLKEILGQQGNNTDGTQGDAGAGEGDGDSGEGVNNAGNGSGPGSQDAPEAYNGSGAANGAPTGPAEGGGMGPGMAPQPPSSSRDPSVSDDPKSIFHYTRTGNADMDRNAKNFEEASRQTGLPANYIAATAWAENRGTTGGDNTRNADGEMDVGVMQTHNETFDDVKSHRPWGNHPPAGVNDWKAGSSDRENILMGAWELRDKYNQTGSYKGASAAYRGHDSSDDATYAQAVTYFWQCIAQGKKLPDDYLGF